jgi:hypothetical protein
LFAPLGVQACMTYRFDVKVTGFWK